jgi:hypothetical protein
MMYIEYHAVDNMYMNNISWSAREREKASTMEAMRVIGRVVLVVVVAKEKGYIYIMV